MPGTSSTAIIVGSGIAGLLSARVLCNHFDSVLLFDRDVIPDVAQQRAGLPQGEHFHALLSGGRQIMERLFPGLVDELTGHGAHVSRAGMDFGFYFPQGRSYTMGYFQPEPIDIGETMLIQSRPLLERAVRERAEALANIQTFYETMVDELTVEDGRATGVTVKAKDGVPRTIAADLVIDAGGKTGRTMRWLGQHGYETPRESVVHCDFGYSSVLMKPKNGDPLDVKGYFVLPADESALRSGGLVKQEGGNWLAFCAGRFGDYPPKTWSEFVEYAETLSHPILKETIQLAEPIAEIAHFRFPSSIRRHFDELESFPQGLLPVGDSLCHFNPVYGQGMTSSALQIQALERLLAERAVAGEELVDGLAEAFFPLAMEVTLTPWLFAALSDFRNPACKGDFPEVDPIDLGNLMALSALAQSDRESGLQAFRIQNLEQPLSALRDEQWQAKFQAAQAMQKPTEGA